jgi:hypothetical protein
MAKQQPLFTVVALLTITRYGTMLLGSLTAGEELPFARWRPDGMLTE